MQINSNLIHNILTLLIVAIPAILIGTGCVQHASGALDCSASWLPPQYALWGVTALGVLKFAINFFRDGIGGFYKAQIPIRPDATVTSVGATPTKVEKEAVKEAKASK